MTYKTILTYIDGEDASLGRLTAAAELTRLFNGHLTVAAVGYNPSVPHFAYGEAAAGIMADLYTAAKADADKHLEVARKHFIAEGVLGDAVPLVTAFGSLPRDIGELAQYSDIVVLSSPYGKDAPRTNVSAFEGAIFDGDAAVLVCPPNAFPIKPKTALIAWNGTREAMRAARRALPMLQLAENIEILVIDPSTIDHDPGERLATMLSRHGMNVEIVVQPRTDYPVSEAIRQHGVELGADLMVMGGYGHSRFREYVIGGVTRDILSNLTVPVLMAH